MSSSIPDDSMCFEFIVPGFQKKRGRRNWTQEMIGEFEKAKLQNPNFCVQQKTRAIAKPKPYDKLTGHMLISKMHKK